MGKHRNIPKLIDGPAPSSSENLRRQVSSSSNKIEKKRGRPPVLRPQTKVIKYLQDYTFKFSCWKEYLEKEDILNTKKLLTLEFVGRAIDGDLTNSEFGPTLPLLYALTDAFRDNENADGENKDWIHAFNEKPTLESSTMFSMVAQIFRDKFDFRTKEKKGSSSWGFQKKNTELARVKRMFSSKITARFLVKLFDARVGRQSAKARSEKLGRELANLGERLNGDDEWHAVFNQRIVLPQFLKDRGYLWAISADEVTPDDIGEEVVTDDDDDETSAADVQQVSCTSQDETVPIFQELKLKKAEYLKMEADFNRDMQHLATLERNVADMKEFLPKQREKLEELKEKVAELEKTTGTTEKYADLARTNSEGLLEMFEFFHEAKTAESSNGKIQIQKKKMIEKVFKAFFRSTDWDNIELVDENDNTNEPSTSGPSTSLLLPSPIVSSGSPCSEPLSPVIPTSNLNVLESVLDGVQNNDGSQENNDENYGTPETTSKSLKRKANDIESDEDVTDDALETRNEIEVNTEQEAETE